MGGRGDIERRVRDLTRFRSPLLRPVSCEIFVELDDDGNPEILSSVEVEGSFGNRILSQSEVDETEVLLMYRRFRRRPENQGRILRVYLEDLTDPSDDNQNNSTDDTDIRPRTAHQDDAGGEPRQFDDVLD